MVTVALSDAWAVSPLWSTAVAVTVSVWLAPGGDPAGQTDYSYVGASSLVATVTNATGTVTLGYDALNRLTGEQDVWGVTIASGYDGLNNRLQETDSLGGTTVSAYDGDGRVTLEEYVAGFGAFIDQRDAFLAGMGALVDSFYSMADRDGDGLISEEEALKYEATLKKPVGPEDRSKPTTPAKK